MASELKIEPAGSLHVGSLSADEARADVRMDGVYFFRSSANYPFKKALDTGDTSNCFMLRRGRVRLSISFPEPYSIDLGPGDIVGLSGLTPHVFQSLEDCNASEVGSFERRELGDEPDRDSDVELIIGVAPSESIALTNMILGPIHLSQSTTPECARRIWKAAELMEEEFQGSGQEYNQAIIVRRIAEIILINMTRSLLMRRGTGSFPLPRTMMNSGILSSIQEFLASPLEHWTVEKLARVSGMSRTKFAEEFRRITGRTPMQTLTRMRLTTMARTLLTDDMRIDEAADMAGYSSSAAFIRAFTREFGMTPLKWRNSHNLGTRQQ